MAIPNKKISQFPLTTPEELQGNTSLKLDVLLNGANKTMPVSQFDDAGILTKAVYDTDNDGVVDDSERLGGRLPETFADYSGGEMYIAGLETPVVADVDYAIQAEVARYAERDAADNVIVNYYAPIDRVDLLESDLNLHITDTDKHIQPNERQYWNDKQELIPYVPEDASKKGEADGYASLDINAKIPLNQIPDSILGQLEYQGVWNAASGTFPTATEKGQYWIANSNGTGATAAYVTGDWAVYNGVSFDKVDNTDAVASVNGKTGTVVLTTTDVQDSTDKRYVTEAEKTKLSNTSGTNSGDETANSIRTKIGNASASGSVGGYLTKTDYDIFNAKQAALGFTPENVANKSLNVVTDAASDTKFPSVKAVKTYVDANIPPLVSGFQQSSQHNPDLKQTTGVQYNGVNGASRLTSTIANGVSTFEVFANVPSNTAAVQYLFSNFKDDGTDGVYIGVHTTAAFQFAIITATGSYGIVSPLKTGWHHIVFVIGGINNSDIKIYIDSRLDTTSVPYTNTLTSLPTSLQNPQVGGRWVGGTTPYNPSTATVSVARMYNYALSNSEVATLWNGGRPNIFRLPSSFIGATNTEMVVNGGFDTDTIWNKSAGATISGGLMNINSVASNFSTLFQQTSPISKNKMYKVTYTVSNYVSGAIVSCPGAWTTGTARSANGTYTDYFLSLSPNTSNTLQFLVSGAAGFVGSVDNVSVTTIGSTLSLEAQNAYSDKWIDNSNLQIATQFNSPAILTADNYAAVTRLEDYNVATINGTGQTKTFVLPIGYFVRDIQIGSKGTVLSNVYCTVGGNYLISGKTVATNKIGRFTMLGDSVIDNASTQAVVIGFDSTTTSGISIVINIERMN